MVEVEVSSRRCEANGAGETAWPANVVVVEEHVAPIPGVITYEYHLERGCLIRLQQQQQQLQQQQQQQQQRAIGGVI